MTNTVFYLITAIFVQISVGHGYKDYEGTATAAIHLFDANFQDENYACKSYSETKRYVDSLSFSPIVSDHNRLCGESAMTPCVAYVHKGFKEVDCDEHCLYKLEVSIPNAAGVGTAVVMFVRIVGFPETQATVSDPKGINTAINLELQAEAFIGICQHVCKVSGSTDKLQDGYYCVTAENCNDVTVVPAEARKEYHESPNLGNMAHCQQAGSGGLITNTSSQTNCPEILQLLSAVSFSVKWTSLNCKVSLHVETEKSSDFETAIDVCDSRDELFYDPIEEGSMCGNTPDTPCGTYVRNLEDESKKRCECAYQARLHLPKCHLKTCTDTFKSYPLFMEARGNLQIENGIHPRLKTDYRLVKNDAIGTWAKFCYNAAPQSGSRKAYIIESGNDNCETGYVDVTDKATVAQHLATLINANDLYIDVGHCIHPASSSLVIVVIVVIVIVIVAIIAYCVFSRSKAD